MNRIYKLTCLLLALSGTFACTIQENKFTYNNAKQNEILGWQKLDDILGNIIPPEFKDTEIIITNLGAKGDGQSDNHVLINQIIEKTSLEGGGTIIFPKGEYFCDGPIHLKSNIHLHLAEDSRIFFGNDPAKYLPAVKVRWEGTVCYNYSPLIYAYMLTNIAITGKGTIDGMGKEWSMDWRTKQNPEKETLRQMGNDLIPEEQRVFGVGFLDLNHDGLDDGYGDGKDHYLRPTLIELYGCENILIKDVSLIHSPFWTLHPVFSKNVTIDGVNILGETLNDDGIDPDGCEYVLIQNCEISTHDDAIAVKAGRDQDAWDRPGSKHIVVRNNQLLSGVNALCIGSEMSGGVEYLFAYDNYIAGGVHALNFKCNLDRGGQVQHIYMRNNLVDTCKEALFIFRMDYHGYRGNHYPTKFNDFYISNIHCKGVEKTPFKIVGVEDQYITRILLDSITIDKAGEESIIEFASDILITNNNITKHASISH